MQKIEVTNENIIETVHASFSDKFDNFSIEVYWDELNKNNRKFVKNIKGEFTIIASDKGKVPINLQDKVKILKLKEDLNHKAIKMLEYNNNRIDVFNSLIESQISPFFVLAVSRNHAIYDTETLREIAEFVPFIFQCNIQYLYGFLAAKIKPKKRGDYNIYIRNKKEKEDKIKDSIIEKLSVEYDICKKEIKHFWPYFIIWCRNGFVPEINFTKKECEYLNIKYYKKKEKKEKKINKGKSLIDF